MTKTERNALFKELTTTVRERCIKPVTRECARDALTHGFLTLYRNERLTVEDMAAMAAHAIAFPGGIEE